MAVGRPPARDTIWTPNRARLWLVACAIAAFLPIVGVPLRGWLDFSAFYAAGSLVFGPEAVQLEPVIRFQAERGLPITPFVYPTGVALPYALFAALPYGVAAALHALLMATFLLVAARLGARVYGLPTRWTVLAVVAWAPAAAGVLSGQNTSLALLLVVAAAAASARAARGWAGALVGALAYKPQLAAPLVGTFVLRGAWRTVVVVAAAVAVHYALGVVATGGRLDWPLDWLATLRAYSGEDLRVNGWQAVSLPALFARAELLSGIPWLGALGYAAGAAVVAACLPALRTWPAAHAIALASAAGLVISPHAWVYDATLLLPALAVYALQARERGWPSRDRWRLAAAYAVAVTWPLGGFVGVSALVIVVTAAPLVLVRRGTAAPLGAPARSMP